jgi:hypothetical protein
MAVHTGLKINIHEAKYYSSDDFAEPNISLCLQPVTAKKYSVPANIGLHMNRINAVITFCPYGHRNQNRNGNLYFTDLTLI